MALRGETVHLANSAAPAQRAFTLFLVADPYLIIGALRTAWHELRVLAPALAIGVWFEFEHNDASNAQLLYIDERLPVLYAFNHDYHRYLPLLLAVLAYVAVHRAGRRCDSRKVGDVAKAVALVVAALAGSVMILWFTPGTMFGRFLPLTIAVPLAWWRRQRRSSWLRPPTTTGFRPSVRALLSPAGWEALRVCRKADPRFPGWTVNIAVELFERAVEQFRRAHDRRSEAYVVARAVEYLLRNNRFSDAETWVRQVATSELCEEPAAITARAQFYRAVGLYKEALENLQRARKLAGWRTPAAVEALLAQVALESGQPERALRFRRYRALRRVVLAWRRQEATVVLHLVAELGVLAQNHPGRALRWLYEVVSLTEELVERMPNDALDPADLGRLYQARALALMAAGSVFERRDADGDAAAAYLDAKEQFETAFDHVGAAICLVLTFTHAVRAGYDGPGEEDHALNNIRVGLQVIENNRGRLRQEEHRSGWIGSQRDLYATVFDLLADGVRYHRAKAAELGLWLLESLHRTALADTIIGRYVDKDPDLIVHLAELRTTETQIAPDREEAAEERRRPADLKRASELRGEISKRLANVHEAALLTDATNTDSVLGLLGDGVALLYHCWRSPAGWVVHCALASHATGIAVARMVLEAEPSERDNSRHSHPVGILDILHDAEHLDSEAVDFELEMLYGTVPLNDDPWRRTACSILPSTLQDVLERTAAAIGRLPRLLVVPDGPVTGLPLPGLTMPSGDMLVDRAVVALTPTLSLLANHDGVDSRPPTQPPIVVTHIDDASFEHAIEEVAAWRRQRGRATVRDTRDRAELAHALRTPPRPDLVVISVHGYRGAPNDGPTPLRKYLGLRDDSVLSAAAALELPWPRIVLLPACWIMATKVTIGHSPLGLPIACMLRGAQTVIGGVLPIHQEKTARIMANLAVAVPTAESVASAVHHEILRELASAPEDRWETPEFWAGILTWTTEPSAPYVAGPQVTSYWTADGLPRRDITPTVSLAFDMQASETLERVLAEARRCASGRPAGTMEFLAATIAIDSADWTGFTVGASVGIPPIHPPSRYEPRPEASIASAGHPDAPITQELAESIRTGERLADHIGDDILLPQHVVYGILSTGDNAAHQYLKSAEENSHELLRLLEARIFGTDLPTADELAPRLDAEASAAHEEHLAGKPATRQQLVVIITCCLVLAAGLYAGLTYVGNKVDIVPEPGYMGIAMEDSPSGPLIVDVIPGSPAAEAGLRVGDIIVSVAEVPTRVKSKVSQIVRAHRPDETLNVVVVREDHPVTHRVTLAASP